MQFRSAITGFYCGKQVKMAAVGSRTFTVFMVKGAVQ